MRQARGGPAGGGLPSPHGKAQAQPSALTPRDALGCGGVPPLGVAAPRAWQGAQGPGAARAALPAATVGGSAGGGAPCAQPCPPRGPRAVTGPFGRARGGIARPFPDSPRGSSSGNICPRRCRSRISAGRPAGRKCRGKNRAQTSSAASPRLQMCEPGSHGPPRRGCFPGTRGRGGAGLARLYLPALGLLPGPARPGPAASPSHSLTASFSAGFALESSPERGLVWGGERSYSHPSSTALLL